VTPRPDAAVRARAGHRRLKAWLIQDAAPLWSTAGVDGHGAFHESLAQDGRPVDGPRRARVQPRQLYALQAARRLGADVDEAVLREGLRAFLARYRRPDGLVRGLVSSEGLALDDGAVLYDQAFALLALAALRPDFGTQVEVSAVDLRAAIIARLGRSQGFETATPPTPLLASNPHMHLLEACLAWMAAGGDADWARLAKGVVDLALDHFIDPISGALREVFDADWRPAEGQAGRLVEPGHQFEWAWLLLRWSRTDGAGPRAVAARIAAMRLLRNGETFGVDPERGVAINGLLDDFSVDDPEARLWPQTERIKAWTLAAAQLDAPWWNIVADAIEGLERYLRTPVPGLWFDRMGVDGALDDVPAPASSFYHIVCAIEALDGVFGDASCAE
jgi:mannose/cellobiose epimerase-like protein (N-acyl-D-glucosamine 2-epimerase family)